MSRTAPQVLANREGTEAILPAHRRFPRVPGTLLTRRIAMGALCVATAGAAALGISLHPAPAHPAAPALAGAAALNADRLDALNRSNRSLQRTAPVATPSTAAPAPKPVATTAKPAAPKPKPTPAKPAPLPGIAGLTATQVNNAWAIVLEGHRMGINSRGQQIAIATAMQESNLYNLRRAVDHDSLGLFQQRPSSGWGSPRQLTNPTYAAHAFYAVLVHYKGAWGTLWRAAQDVQRSAFPYAYQKHSSAAWHVVSILDKRF
jgi:hypothetical protein